MGLTVGWAIGAAIKSTGMMALDKCYAASQIPLMEVQEQLQRTQY